MNPSSPPIIKQILAAYGIKPQKGLGQHFLIDQNIVKKMAASANLQPSDVVLEIGPGLGALTQELARRARHVIAIEKDAKMVEILKETLSGCPNVEIIHADALKSNYLLPTTDYRLVANLPYYITAPVIRRFLEIVEVRPRTMVLMVQKEVARRICAKVPGMNLLAVSVQFYAAAKIIAYVKKASFWPQPEVDSAIVRITPAVDKSQVNPNNFFRVVKAGFKQPRKQLLNNLSASLNLPRQRAEQWLLENHIQPTRRAETLSIQDWISLANSLERLYNNEA